MTKKIAILGLGRIGRMHAEILSHRIDGIDVTLLFDAYEQSAQSVGTQLNIPVASSLDEVFDSNVDAVAICTSTDTHAELVIASAEAGKAIFLEKPVSLHLPDVDRALAAVSSASVPLQVGFNRRFDPAHAAVQQAVASGQVGEVQLVKITSRDPQPPPIEYVKVSGGIFLDMMIHDFDMARFVVGSEVVQVYATAAVRVDPAIGEVGDADTAVVVLTHEDGTITSIDNSRQAVYGYDQRVEVFGSKGMARSENPRRHTAEIHSAEGTSLTPVPHFFLERYEESYVAEWRSFVAGLDSGELPVTGADGRAPLVIGLAALESIRTKKPVDVSSIAVRTN